MWLEYVPREITRAQFLQINGNINRKEINSLQKIYKIQNAIDSYFHDVPDDINLNVRRKLS